MFQCSFARIYHDYQRQALELGVSVRTTIGLVGIRFVCLQMLRLFSSRLNFLVFVFIEFALYDMMKPGSGILQTSILFEFVSNLYSIRDFYTLRLIEI